ncbi:alkane hydroxylase MAH1-like [Silene latifolia]|uniref:alkane hydroxylase MAH1-like n=1 Tax=Silene latifolia TaxID=37657 RepID=UPI003D78403A
MADSLPWILLNVYRFHDTSLGFLRRSNGTYFRSGRWFGASDFLATSDPANVHYIATTNFSNYPKGDDYRKAFDVMGYALFNSDDDDWKQYRRLIHNPIKSRKFLNYSIKTAHANLNHILVPILKHASEHSDRVLDLQDVFQRFALDVTCKSLTGHDPKSLAIDLPTMPFLGAMADFERGIIYRIAFPELLWKLQLMLRVGPEYRLNLARKVINSYISNIVFKKRHDVLTEKCNTNEDEDEVEVDFLELLMKDVMKDGLTQITHINDDAFFKDITIQQLMAGRDTISSAMTWFSWLITTHPKVEEKIRDEIEDTISEAKAKGWRVFNSEETSNLVYLHAALLESMRLYPPAPFQYKTPRQLDTLPTGHPVYPKTKILIALYAMARMKSLWGDNCSEFEPERWISDRGTIKHEPSSKYLIFYTGPRSCMGKDAALTQMKMVAATLIHNFRFELVKGQKIQPDVSMILHVKHGFNVKVHNRWT